MKFAQVGFLVSVAITASASRKHDLIGRRGGVAVLDGNEKVNHDTHEIIQYDPETFMEHAFRCPKSQGTRLSFSSCEGYVACCFPGQRLIGSPDTAFGCCGEGHEIAGTASTGYTCCPTGQIYDGKKCGDTKTESVCHNGKLLVNGKCDCPSSTKEGADGLCHSRNNAPCDSGIQEGKCYSIEMENGNILGHMIDGGYTAGSMKREKIDGKFKFCLSEACNGGRSINPADNFRIRDLHSDAAGQHANQWIDHNVNGAHLNKVAEYNKAGVFSLTKWSCGKYCLSGDENHGLGPACPSENIAMTFLTSNKDVCRPIKIVEVPCNNRDITNNCLWDKPMDTC
ncbi:hypothetical protein BROUX41_003729 [Berkeleyomyces rouxiae]|uniref:uncharacterized protein n=1 Tax=Berkeleyomyces rouxiae TaxID=2035830 RepID=UPI003B80300E